MKEEVLAAARWWADSCHRRGLSERQIQIFRFELEQCLLQRCVSLLGHNSNHEVRSFFSAQTEAIHSFSVFVSSVPFRFWILFSGMKAIGTRIVQ
jgi:hypothetical protein